MIHIHGQRKQIGSQIISLGPCARSSLNSATVKTTGKWRVLPLSNNLIGVATLVPLEHCFVCYKIYSDISINCFISVGQHLSKGKQKANEDGPKEKAPRTKKLKISKTPPRNVTIIDLDSDDEIPSTMVGGTAASTLSVPLPPNTLPALASSSSSEYSVPLTSKSTTMPVSICDPEVLLSSSEPPQGESQEVAVTKPSMSPSLLILSVSDVIFPAIAFGSDLDGASNTRATASDSVDNGIQPLEPTINQGRSELLPSVEASTSNENCSRIQRVSCSLKSV